MNTRGRRNFLTGSALAAGAAWLVGNTTGRRASAASKPPAPVARSERLPREVWIATISLHGIRVKNPDEMTREVLGLMEEIAPQEPDVICLPETFAVSNMSGPIPSLAQRAEEGLGQVAAPYAEFARKHGCYVVCPIHTKREDRYFNSAVFIDRHGKLLGDYHKMHPTTGEIEAGVSPGPLEPPVFETDFGKVGAQICFDIEWLDGWMKLAEAGAEIVFWPSAFAGGTMVNTKAWQNQYCVVSSTLKNTSKICDVTGTEVAKTSHWNRWVCAPVNLEKAFLHTWPYVQRFDEIQAKYGRAIRITNFAEEEWSILESRSPDLKIADVMQEFELKTLREHLSTADTMQCRCR